MSKLLIVDDHALVREGLKRALAHEGFSQITEASSIAQARAGIAASQPEVVTVDINLPDGSGFELVRWIRGISQDMAIVVLTLNNHQNYIRAAMKAGASAFVSKSEPIPALVAAIKHSLITPLSFSAQGLEKLFNNTHNTLTAREFDLLVQLEQGHTTAQISKSLFISPATVKTHLASIYRKLEVTNRTAAIHAMREQGLSSK
jgi:DNA-binding NarL/FixJ family response regulator